MRPHFKRRHFFTLAIVMVASYLALMALTIWGVNWDRERTDFRLFSHHVHNVAEMVQMDLAAALKEIAFDSSPQKSADIALTGTIRDGKLVFPWEEDPATAALQPSALQQALDLRRAFDLRILSPSARVWESFGPEPWLVGFGPTRDDGAQTVVAIRSAPILARLEHLFGRIRFSTKPMIGEPLAPEFPVWTKPMIAEPLAPEFPGLWLIVSSRRSVSANSYPVETLASGHGLEVASVIAITIIGMFFVVRDVDRQLRLADLRGQFVASVSHELRTPLTAIRMFAETLEMDRPAAPAARTEYLRTIVGESERLTRLVDNVLDFSKVDDGRRSYRFESVSLSAILGQVVETLQYLLSKGSFELRVSVENDMPPMRADADAIQQALLNLLSNAMKYSGESRRIDLALKKVGEYAVISVTDYGLGIAKQEQLMIFQRYYRVPTVENARIAGAGLGLALVDHIVKAHGGTVDVTSTPGLGSTFSIRLPLDHGAL